MLCEGSYDPRYLVAKFEGMQPQFLAKHEDNYNNFAGPFITWGKVLHKYYSLIFTKMNQNSFILGVKESFTPAPGAEKGKQM